MSSKEGFMNWQGTKSSVGKSVMAFTVTLEAFEVDGAEFRDC